MSVYTLNVRTHKTIVLLLLYACVTIVKKFVTIISAVSFNVVTILGLSCLLFNTPWLMFNCFVLLSRVYCS